jgi:hypothetical protein
MNEGKGREYHVVRVKFIEKRNSTYLNTLFLKFDQDE